MKATAVQTPNGVLLVNLGSPDSPSVPDVRRYLDEFLMDGRVLDYPYPLRRLIVSAFILPTRPQQSAAAYHAIWRQEGSPLIVNSRRLQHKLGAEMNLPLALAMRYGQPDLAAGFRELLKQGVKRILLVPLYPHYALSTFETVAVAARQALRRMNSKVKLEVLKPFYDHPAYLTALVESARPYLAQAHDHLLFSFHGVPERHLRKTDPTRKHCLSSPDCCSTPSPAHTTCYRRQVFETTRLFSEQADLDRARTSLAFQSRLGRDPWLTPFTDAEITRLAQSGVRRLLVICPAFIADCLETLEEIGIRGKETFLAAGGETFQLIPCLNDQPAWISALRRLIGEALAGFDSA